MLWFDDFEPGLSRADSLLASPTEPEHARLTEIVVAADPVVAAELLNVLLADTASGLRLRLDGGRWRLDPVTDADVPDRLASAAVGIARLVAVDGWRRLKPCAVAGCPRGVIDRTTAVRRRYCAGHSRHG